MRNIDVWRNLCDCLGEDPRRLDARGSADMLLSQGKRFDEAPAGASLRDWLAAACQLERQSGGPRLWLAVYAAAYKAGPHLVVEDEQAIRKVLRPIKAGRL